MNVNPSFPSETDASAKRLALAHWVKKRRWFLLAVVLPTLLTALYYGLIASDIYVSESRFIIKSPDQKRSQVSTLANLVQTTGLSGGQEQTHEVLTFVRSRDALKALEKRADIRDKFATSQADFFSRFAQAAVPCDGFDKTQDLVIDKTLGAITFRLENRTGDAHATGLRLALHTFTIVWLVSCFIYSVKVVWWL